MRSKQRTHSGGSSHMRRRKRRLPRLPICIHTRQVTERHTGREEDVMELDSVDWGRMGTPLRPRVCRPGEADADRG